MSAKEFHGQSPDAERLLEVAQQCLRLGANENERAELLKLSSITRTSTWGLLLRNNKTMQMRRLPATDAAVVLICA